MSRTQRCGHCEGCLAKACGTCVYCKDNPQYGGPGVKKQSCVARRCTRVLEGKLQREANGLRAKAGCGYCDECLQMDCGACLICLDKRFFRGRFLPNALCAKKKCSSARSLDVSPRHTPSPFKAKHDSSRGSHDRRDTINGGNSMASPQHYVRKRLMSDDVSASSSEYASLKKLKKLSDASGRVSTTSVINRQHPVNISPYCNNVVPGSFPSSTNNGLLIGQSKYAPTVNHSGVISGNAASCPTAYQSTKMQQNNCYNGSPPAGTVAPLAPAGCSSSSAGDSQHFNALGRDSASYQLHQPYTPNLAMNKDSDFYRTSSTRLAASCSGSSNGYQSLQPPPYQWATLPSSCGRVPFSAANLDGNNNNAPGDYSTLRDRPATSTNDYLNYYGNLTDNQSSIDSADKQSKYVQSNNYNRFTDKSQLHYQANHYNGYYQHYVTNGNYAANNQHHYLSPTTIVTEQPMGPMDESKIVLQQL